MCFAVTIAGETDEIKTIQGPVIKTNISLEAAAAGLSRFGVLIIPGSDYKDTKDLRDTETHPIKNLIRQFSLLPSKNTRRHPRLLVSVCSGASMLASVGALAGLRVTMHYGLLPQLQELYDKHGQTEISRK